MRKSTDFASPRFALVLAAAVLVIASNAAGSASASSAPTAAVTAASATFGYAGIGATNYTSAADKKRVSQYALSESGDLSKLSLYLAGAGGSGTQVLKGVVYADSGGEPGALVGVTAEITVGAADAPGWRDLPFASPLRLAAGNYWLGFIAGATGSLLRFYYDEYVGAYRSASDVYGDGPSDPFGSSSSAQRKLSVYATYTPTGSTDPVIAAAGNIACDPASASFNGGLGTAMECREKYTSDLLVGTTLTAILSLGDNQYMCGGYNAFLQAFDPTWGRVKSLIRPAPGNHDYATSGGTDCGPAGSGYFSYFGAAAGDPSQGYYSFDIGRWHLIALNSNCAQIGGCGVGSPQETWLKNDLATHPAACTLAYWHHPRFSSSWSGSNPAYDAFWQDLYAAGAEIVLVGHDHVYERFAPQDPSEKATPLGIREFIVGTGGFSHHDFFTIRPNSQVRNNDTFGVLRLTLHPNSYDWQFVPEAGKTFTDAGSTTCH